MKCNYCGAEVDEQTISRHGFCIPCMDEIIDAGDCWAGVLEELTRELPTYGKLVRELQLRQKTISSLLFEVRSVLRDQGYVPKQPKHQSGKPATGGYLHMCPWCGDRYRGLKLHQRHCKDRPAVNQEVHR